MSGALCRIGRACFARKWRVVVIWLVLLVAAGAAMKIGEGQLDNTFTSPGSQSQAALDQGQTGFPDSGGTSAHLVFGASGGSTLNSSPSAAVINQALSQAAQANRVSGSRLDSGTPNSPSSIASSADSNTVSVQAGRQAFSSVSSGSGSSDVTGLLIALAILTVALAALVAAGMPLLTALTGVSVSVLILYGLSAALSVSNTAVTLAVMIGLAAGVDYALFIVSRHRAQLAAGVAPAESAAMAAGTAGTAVVFAGSTVIVALTALSAVGIPY